MNGNRFSSRAKSLLLSIIGALVYLAIIGGNQLFAQEQRLWRDNTGTFEVEATLQSFKDDAIVLKLPDGRTVDVPLRRLSDKDLEYAQNVRAANAFSQHSKTSPPKVESSPPVTAPNPPLLAIEPEPTVPSPDPATAKPVVEPPAVATHSLPPAFSIALDPEFELLDEPPADWIPAEPKIVALPTFPDEANSIELPPNPENLKLIGISPPTSDESHQKIAASPVSEKQILPESVEQPENDALSLVPEPAETVGPTTNNLADPSLGNAPPLTPVTSTVPGIIAPEVNEPAVSGDSPGRPSMPVSLQATLNSLLAEMKTTTDGEKLRGQLFRLSQLNVPLNDPPTLEALRQHMSSNDKYIRETVLQKIISLSSRLDSETLKQAVADESQAIRWKAYDMLIADPRPDLLPLLLERAPEYDRNKIIAAIGAYGAVAEPLLWPLLESSNAGFRLDIARLLSDIGTEKSVPYLKKTAENDSLPLVEVLQAKSSIRKIESRK